MHEASAVQLGVPSQAGPELGPAPLETRTEHGLVYRKKALITGGRGIGAAVALEFLGEGADIIFVMSRSPIDELRRKAEADGYDSERIIWLPTDIADDSQLQLSMRSIRKDHRAKLDIIVNNAGITEQGTEAMIDRSSPAIMDRILKTNLIAAHMIPVHAFNMNLFPENGAVVVNNASILGMYPTGGGATYAESKGALIRYTEVAARELAQYGIRVVAVAPGFITTEMTSQIDPRLQRILNAVTPAGRQGRPEEVAALITFLASDKASYMNGSVYPVDGGVGPAAAGAFSFYEQGGDILDADETGMLEQFRKQRKAEVASDENS